MFESSAAVFARLEENGARFPGSVALASLNGVMNYQGLVGNIASAVVAARKAGIGPGHLVVVAIANQDIAFVVALALMRIGCRVGYSPNLELYDLSGVKIDFVIADKAAAIRGRPVLLISPDWFRGEAGINLQLPPVATDFSMITSSSGSTGRAKLIEAPAGTVPRRLGLSISALLGEGRSRLLSLGGERVLQIFWESVAVLVNGGMLVRPVNRRALVILDTIELLRPDVVSIPPAPLLEVMRVLDARPNFEFKVRMLRSIGAYFAPHVQNAVLDRLAENVMSVYGSVETGWIAWGLSSELQKVPGSVGRVADDREIAAFSSDGRELPPGSEGEIRLKEPDDATSTYLGGNSAQQSVFTDGWFATGDIGMVDENRNLIIRGRASNVINTGGDKANPEDIETQLRTFDEVLDVGVTGVDIADGFQQICAVIVSSSVMDLDDINTRLRQRKIRWPVQILKSVSEIPKTQTGKIDRKALKRLCAE